MPRHRKRSRRISFKRRRIYGGLKRFRRKLRGGRIKARSQGRLLADRTKVKLTYTLLFNAATDANGLYTYLFSGNSPYDPDVTGVGFQPTGYDQWSAFYRFYYCSGSSIRIALMNLDSTKLLRWGVVPGTNQLSTGDLATMDPIEWPYCKYRDAGPLSSSKSYTRLKSYMSTKKIYGYRTATNNNFIASVTGNPTNIWYWNLFVNTPSLASSNITLSLTITYYVTFFGRQEISIS